MSLDDEGRIARHNRFKQDFGTPDGIQTLERELKVKQVLYVKWRESHPTEAAYLDAQEVLSKLGGDRRLNKAQVEEIREANRTVRRLKDKIKEGDYLEGNDMLGNVTSAQRNLNVANTALRESGLK